MAEGLCEAEVFAPGCHGGVDLLPESFVTVVFWKIQFCTEVFSSTFTSHRRRIVELTIETSMRTRQPILIAVVAMDVEFTKAVHALELAEAIERHLTRTSNEL